ncbi:putative HHIP-like protein 2 isoform X1 [Apostichopus japonicus]|uniref:Putative HHIP-like protein 2 isoform X1 n=1 Tax=Stichopus japonicus TaxID=307972 RepID=A0A2G8JH78_STIJA|nr:putative HHIP-like protein 2 isoform X1 [Apostichopus japonicus]
MEQTGVVNVFFRNGSYLEDPFLNIEDLVYVSGRRGDERGLLGLAFHPSYAENANSTYITPQGKWRPSYNYVDPIHVYPHSDGKSVTGGYVYRGCMYPHLQGLYIYGDFWNGRLFKLEESEGEWENKEICLGTKDICTGDLWNYFPENILSFGEDEAGELYMMVTDLASSTHSGGKIFKFVDPNKRGNPEECHVEPIPVPVFGSILPFQPSTGCKGVLQNSSRENFSVSSILFRSVLYEVPRDQQSGSNL